MKIEPKACPFPQCLSAGIASEIRAEEALLAQENKQRNDFIRRRIAARQSNLTHAFIEAEGRGEPEVDDGWDLIMGAAEEESDGDDDEHNHNQDVKGKGKCPEQVRKSQIKLTPDGRGWMPHPSRTVPFSSPESENEVETEAEKNKKQKEIDNECIHSASQFHGARGRLDGVCDPHIDSGIAMNNDELMPPMNLVRGKRVKVKTSISRCKGDSGAAMDVLFPIHDRQGPANQGSSSEDDTPKIFLPERQISARQAEMEQRANDFINNDIKRELHSDMPGRLAHQRNSPWANVRRLLIDEVRGP
ncbi:hypothetical protein N3K66_005611 [Trichothecium roseum]|uniref:Uncharacterized protein n=1 Tax=Trichothecium roseum TaxID=47278 RepID=A0ACC0V103_9HYPO|nr:hypothetical protein N3K66_005611 [Trichothecium roseum]